MLQKPSLEKLRRPSPWAVHGALILAQVLFGGGSVVGKLGVHKFNPMLFALIRECCAGPVLLALAVAFDGRVVPYRGDWPLIFVMGLCVVMNQALFIIGDKLAGPIISSAWQCSQPIMALMISVALGWEKITNGKFSGILLSVVGGGFLVCYGQSLQSSEAIGNLLLAVNCLATALYVIFSKIALQRYPPLTITAWAAMVACVIMAVVATSVNSHCGFVNFVCPEDPNEAMFRCHSYRNSCAPWAVPDTAILPLAYWIGCTSITGHFLITWANRHARAGYILAYAAIQPFTSTMVTVILILCGVHGLKMPGWNALGIVGILMGLFLLVLDGKKQHEADEELCDSRCL
mmetsp:Transcript_79371/g.161453  ORF Transcript_79371/g.161453 Transcript_79371/m.161453 type:complete len:347 (-) Transcript_79371:40-1080(-)